MTARPSSDSDDQDRCDPNASTGKLHVAIVMDGNGRWAVKRGFPRTIGHEQGVEALRRVVEAAREMPISTLTVFSFSTENWLRPQSEISALFGLLRGYVARDLDRLTREGVRIRVIGSREKLSADICALIDKAEQQTQHNTHFTLVIAFNYGARAELVQATRCIAEKVRAGQISPDEIDDEAIHEHLWTAGMPDPDLLIRTSGEQRLSNFLLWQMAYTELYFTDTLWPDFDQKELMIALDQFHVRSRRFGSVVSAKS